MIRYDNKQNMFSVIFERRGSVFKATLWPSLGSAVLTQILALAHKGVLPGPVFNPAFDHPFPVQIYAILLGFVIVCRVDLAVTRYRDGISDIMLMTSKWADAFMQLRAFIIVEQATCSQEVCDELSEFLFENLHAYSLLNALAMTTLADELPDLDRFKFKKHPHMGFLHAVTKEDEKANLVPVNNTKFTRADEEGRRKIFKAAKVNPAMIKGLPFKVIGSPIIGEYESLSAMPDMLTAVMYQIIEGVVRLHAGGKLHVPGPIISRFFQEMSNGMLGYNQAMKVALVPFPYPYAQIIAWLLTMLVFLCPVMSVSMAPGWTLSAALSFFVIFGYFNLNEVAKVLEMPFGDDPSDLPLVETHDCFIEALEGVFAGAPRLVNARLPPRAARPPDPVVLALNQEIGKSKSTRWLNAELSYTCYEAWTQDDFVRKFGSKAMGARIHAKLRELIEAEEKKRRKMPNQAAFTDKGVFETTQVLDFNAKPPETARMPEAVHSPLTAPNALPMGQGHIGLLIGEGHGDTTMLFRAGT